MTTRTSNDISPSGAPLELLFERSNLPRLPLPALLEANYGGPLGFDSPRVFANFVTSVDGVVALPGDAESGQIISGRNSADRFLMGLLRACADAVLIGAGTFRHSRGHLWHPDRIYPAAAPLFAEARRALGLRPAPRLVLVSASGELDVNEPAVHDALIVTTQRGQARLQGRTPASARVIVAGAERIALPQVLELVREQGLRQVLTEGGPSLFSELVAGNSIDELFVTTAPSLFGRFAHDQRKSLADGLDLAGRKMELLSARRHGSHLFLRYAFDRSAV